MSHKPNENADLPTLIAITVHPDIIPALKTLNKTDDLSVAAGIFEQIQRRIIDAELDGESLCHPRDRVRWQDCIQRLREGYRPHIIAARSCYQRNSVS